MEYLPLIIHPTNPVPPPEPGEPANNGPVFVKSKILFGISAENDADPVRLSVEFVPLLPAVNCTLQIIFWSKSFPNVTDSSIEFIDHVIFRWLAINNTGVTE